MNTSVFTTHPAVSNTLITSDQQRNNHTLDKLLAVNRKTDTYWTTPSEELSAGWFTESEYLGLDENKYPMNSLTRGERWLFITGAIMGSALLGSLLTWICMCV